MLCPVSIVPVTSQPISAGQMLFLLEQREKTIQYSQGCVLQVLQDQSRQIDILDREIANLWHQLLSLKKKQKKTQSILDEFPERFRYLHRKKLGLQKRCEDTHIGIQKISLIEKEFRLLLQDVLKQSRPLIEALYMTQDPGEKERVHLIMWRNKQTEQFCWKELDQCRNRSEEGEREKKSLLSQIQQVELSQQHLLEKQRAVEEDLFCAYAWKKSVQRALYSQQTLRLEAIVQKQIAEIEWNQLYRAQQQLTLQKKNFFHVLAYFTQGKQS